MIRTMSKIILRFAAIWLIVAFFTTAWKAITGNADTYAVGFFTGGLTGMLFYELILPLIKQKPGRTSDRY